MVTPADDKVSMNMDMLDNIVTTALEDEKRLANATTASFTVGVKKGSELQMKPLHSSPIEQEVAHFPVQQCPLVPLKVNGLHSVHLLMSRIGNVGGPSTVNNFQPVQSVSKLPVTTSTNGVIASGLSFVVLGEIEGRHGEGPSCSTRQTNR